MMIKALIIEDEPKVRETLIYLLNKYCPELEICGVAANFEEGYTLACDKHPDLLFADIELNSLEGTGLDLIKILNDKGPAVIFISGWKDYAIDAFRLNAIDYLLKPINIDQLKQAVQKARAYIRHYMAGNTEVSETLHIPTQHGFIIIFQKDLVRCEAEGPYTYFHLINKSNAIISAINLGQVEKKLNKTYFFRIHKSHIANRSHIIEYQRGEGGIVKMTDSCGLPVSRQVKERFLSWLG